MPASAERQDKVDTINPTDSGQHEPGATRTVVLVTATELEPRTFGKQVVIGGLLDHLVLRLGPDNVHVVVVGREAPRREAPDYHLHFIAKPTAVQQVLSIVSRVGLRPHTSLQEAALWSPRVLSALSQELAAINADLEIYDTMRTGQYALAMERRQRVLYADDLFSKRYATMLERIRQDRTRVVNPLGEFHKILPGAVRALVGHPWVYRPLLRIERHLVQRSEDRAPAAFDKTLLVSAAETRELAERTASSTVHTLEPLIKEPARQQRRYDGRPTFVFLGGLDFPPNRDGLSWFLSSCREAVLGALPDFELLIVGRGSEQPLPEAADWGQHVRQLGWVDDLDEVLLGAAALISPLRISSGTKIKVMEALARGLPVVATPQGVLGLDVGRDDGCLVGSTPAELAQLMVESADQATNSVLSAAALSTWDARLSPAAVRPHYDELLNLPGQHEPPPPPPD
jgi:glycosyltransferase involved in cell wall biosynthesis